MNTEIQKLIKKLEKRYERMAKSIEGNKLSRFIIALQKIFCRKQHLKDVEKILKVLKKEEMTENLRRLIYSLKIRREQLKADVCNRKYRLHDGHHLRDIMTTLEVWHDWIDTIKIEKLLENMPQEKDRPYKH